MIKIKESCYKGTSIIIGNQKRILINNMIEKLLSVGFVEIQIPIIQFSETFKNKVGEENNNLMYNFTDRANRKLCLTPEITAVIQPLANTIFKDKKDVKLFYVSECFRGEKPQKGRYRQFTQLGVEILNPSSDKSIFIKQLAGDLLDYDASKYNLISNNIRGLDYYNGFTFEIENIENKLSVCGGGAYENGIGFAIGIDRFLELK
jgi:histidyl-tRNA synthetase